MINFLCKKYLRHAVDSGVGELAKSNKLISDVNIKRKMSCVSNNMERGAMEMENLLDMLANAREKHGIVGITRKPREEQKEILESLLHKFDAAEDSQKVVAQWGFDAKKTCNDVNEA